MTGDGRRELVTELRSMLAAADGLPTGDVHSITELIEVGELVIALETLCTQIYEYDIHVDTSQRSRLEALGAALRVPVAYLPGDPWAASPREDGA